MACKDCFNNCGVDGPISDQCVKYTGPDIPLLDICEGDPVSKVEEILIDKLLSALDGTGITPADVTIENCEAVKEAIGNKEPTLINLLQTLIDLQCTWKEAIDDLQGSADNFLFDVKCLTLNDSPTRDDILQAAINILCSVKSTVDTIPTTYVKTSDLSTQVTTIITQQGSASTQYYNRLIPFVAVPYFGSLSNFDNTGKGYSQYGFDKIYLCNGLNNTPDLRGRTIVGAVKNVPGGVLDAAVDPTNPINQNTDYALKDKFGENYNKLLISNIPAHSHTITDPGHAHEYDGYEGENRPGGNNVAREDRPRKKTTSSVKTGITLGNTGGDVPHNNRQPSIAAYFIMYIP